MSYTTERFRATISVEEYLEKYVDIPTFQECCKSCGCYEHNWACPPYDFDVEEYWHKYKTLDLTAVKIIFSEEMTSRIYTKDEIDKITRESLWEERKNLSGELMKLEKEIPQSISLSAGSCLNCKTCTRPEGLPCRHPESMRHSIESMGGNVGLTISKLMGIELERMEEGKLPNHFVLVCGLLH